MLIMKKLPRFILPFLIPVIAILIVLNGTDNLSAKQDSQAAARLESSLRQAIAAEYAVTGAYPESLDSITSVYGIKINTSQYAVFYTPVAENLPPDLTVLDLEASP